MTYRASTAEKELVHVPTAGQLFEEPGTIEAVAQHARRWFSRHMPPVCAARPAVEAERSPA
jgi:hypothetical protein